MTQEEKAHRYDEAIIKVKALYGQPLVDNTLLETIFPELKESEDERIRKAIHIYLDWLDGHKDYQPKGDYTIKDMIAWLEKQGESYIKRDVDDAYAEGISQRMISAEAKEAMYAKPAWSEEDEKMLECALDMIEWYSGKNKDKSRLVSGWLKSLRPQTQWKPSDEQMEVLKEATSIVGSKYKSCLNSLYSDLKKLKD